MLGYSAAEVGSSMAAASSTLVETVNINLEDFSETFLTCSTCLHTYDQETRKAKLLPCSHSCCLSCLSQLAALSQNAPQRLRCPMCREECPLPAGGVSALPAAFLINQLLDVMHRQRKDVVPSCATHPSDALLYCECCDLVFCQHCQTSVINKKCTQHTVVPFSIALKRMSEIVVYRARGRLTALSQASAVVSDEIEMLDQNVDSIVDQINSTFQEVSRIVEARRRELIEGARVRRDQKRKVLKDQLEAIADEKKRLEKELDSCQVDVRAMARQLKALDGAADQQLTQPRENAYLRLETNSSQLICDIQKSLSSFGSLSASTTFPAESTIEQTDPACTHIETKLLVRTRDVEGRSRTEGGDPLTATLERVEADGATADCTIAVRDQENGTYTLVFTVLQAGEYRAHVSVFGRAVKNSPFSVTVSSHHSPRWQLPAALKQPVRVAIHDTHLFYVLDTGNNRIRCVKDTGDVVRDISSPALEGGSAVGLALLANEHMAVLNWRTKSLSVLDVQGDVQQAINFSEFNEPIDLAVDRRGRFLIADTEKVFVFDSSLRPVFSFPARGQSITCVAVGVEDDILVGTNAGLLLFDGAGRFLRNINAAPPDAKNRQMVSACCVCPSSGLIVSAVVCAKTNKAQLAVSQYKGHFSFCLDGAGSRLRRPCGLAIGCGERDGQAFVVDHATHTVKMFQFK